MNSELRRGPDLGLFTPNYDIDPAREAAYLEWLHGEHLPRTLAEGSFSAISHCIAVEAPKRFQLLELMPSYTAFHSVGRLEAAKKLPSNVAEMMALRLGQRRNHHAEVTRVDGPAASSRGESVALGPVVYLLRFDIEPVGQIDFNAWLCREHNKAAEEMSGLLSFRRYLTVEGEPDNLLLYEFESVDAVRAGALDNAWSTEWARKVSDTITHDSDSKVIYERIWNQG